MQEDLRQKNATSQSLQVFFRDNTTGLGKTGLVFNTAGISINYFRPGSAAITNIALVTLAALNTAYASGGFKEIGGGWYRLDVPNAAIATGVSRVIFYGQTSDSEMQPVLVTLTDYDPIAEGDDAIDVRTEMDSNSVDLNTLVTAAADIQARLPAALVSGKMDSHTASIANGLITAAVVAAGAVDADAVASDAVTKIVTGLLTTSLGAAYSNHTVADVLKIVLAVLASKASGLDTTTATFRNPADTGNVIVATVDADGNRSSVTRTP